MKRSLLSVAVLLCLTATARPGTAQSNVSADSLTLSRALAAGLASDPRLTAASFSIEEATAAQEAAGAYRRPSVSLSASLVRYGEPMLVSPVHSFAPTRLPAFDETLLHAGVLASQTVYDGGASGARVQRARSLRAAAQAGLDEVRSTVLQDVVQAYLGVLSARDASGAQEERLREVQAEVDRARRFFDEGSAPRLELLRAEAEAGAARADVEVARTRLRVASNSLARLVGAAPETVASSPLRDVAPPRETADLPTPGPSEPTSVLVARQRVSAAEAQVDEAHAARRPRVFATGALQEFGGGFSDFATEWQGGFEVEYALFTGGARARAMDQALAAQRVAEAQLDQVQREVADAADVARAARDEARARSAALQDAVLGFEELERVERLALDEGAGVQRDYLNATASLAQARASLSEARRAQVLAEVGLARAQGRLTLDWLTTIDQVTP